MSEVGVGAFPFVTVVSTRHTDLDAQKIVSNVALAEIFEEARTRYSLDRRLKASFDPFRRLLSKVSIAFVSDGRYPRDLDVGVAVTHLHSHGWTLRLVASDGPVCIATCESEFELSSDDGKAALPAGLVEKLRGDLSPEAAERS
jgi:acyl-CoA thioester hydrolase